MQSEDFSRSDRLADQIKSEISIILRDQVKDPRLKGLTILKVQLSTDIKKASVYYSPFNSFKDINLEDIKEGLSKAKGFIRRVLAKRLKVKRIPEISFEPEPSEFLEF
tara:strand:+ start:331 stop:654 length:324 start_codon:yes stop_codon:yes gene_type:complete